MSKIYNCDICEREFDNKISLSNHRRWHDLPEYKKFQESNLKKQRKRKHTEESKAKMIKNRKGKNSGEKCWNWKGGIRTSNNYRYVLKPNHPRASNNGYVPEQILIIEEKLGRSLKFYGRMHKDNEIVHHIDCDSLNNDPENLYACFRFNHSKLHNKFGLMTGELFKKSIIYFDRNKGEYKLTKSD